MQSYRIVTPGSLENLTRREEDRPQISEHDVLVRIKAVSLNARDLMMLFGPQPYGPKSDIIPVSDGAGEIVECGSEVEGLSPGMRVVLPFRPGWLDGPYNPADVATDLGGAVDGVLCEYVAIAASAVVRLPDDMSFEAAATLPCAGVTAWSALMRGAPIGPGQTVLTLGTGGVSIFALQIAKAMGCTVIATTSSPDKEQRLAALGADHVINSASTPDWGTAARNLTGGRGVDRVVEVGGAGSLPMSMSALAPEGEIALLGLLDNPMNTISPIPLMTVMGVLRGISVGSRADLQALLDMTHRNFAPAIDRIFSFDEAAEAFACLATRRHVGKLIIRL